MSGARRSRPAVSGGPLAGLRLRAGAVALGASIAVGMLSWSGFIASARAEGCITRLPVSVTMPSSFAAGYQSRIPLRVSTSGNPIRNLRAAIYTFSGDQIAAGHRTATLFSSATVNLKLAFGPLQEGSYTLVVTGEPNASRSCGPKKLVRVVRFHGCITSLPLRFVSPPGGTASDYRGFLSVTLQSTGPLIHTVEGSVYDVNGVLFGRGTLSALYGQTSLNMALNQPLLPGDYSVVVAGLIEQPRSCGPKSAKIELHFK